MKKLLVLSILTAFIAGGAVFANTSGNTTENSRGYVSVEATSSAELEPNQAVVTFSVEANKKELSEVTEELNSISAKLNEAVKAKLQEKDTIKTTSYSVVPIYYQKDKKRVLLGYKASTKMIVTTKNIKNLSNIIGTALNNGAISVTGLNFSLTDYNTKCNELVSSASKKAYNDAFAIAKSVNSNIDGVKHIKSTCGMQQSCRFAKTNSLKALATDNAIEETTKSMPSVEPGTINIQADIDASFYVK